MDEKKFYLFLGRFFFFNKGPDLPGIRGSVTKPNMSDTLNDSAGAAPAVDTAAPAPAPDVTTVDSSPPPTADTTPAPSTREPDFDKMFGLPAEEAPVDKGKTPDAKAPDQPAAHPGTEKVEQGTDDKAKAEAPADQTPAADVTAKTEPADKKPGEFQPNEKLNWDDDKVPFRKEFQELKKEYMNLRESSVETQYVNEPQEFAKWMKETSPTSFTQVGGILATESAQTHPKEWLEYFAKEKPDLLAEIASGREGMTADRLKAELSVILDEDDPDVQAKLAKGQAEAEAAKAPVETPEQQRVREILEREDAKEVQQAYGVLLRYLPLCSSVLCRLNDLCLDRIG